MGMGEGHEEEETGNEPRTMEEGRDKARLERRDASDLRPSERQNLPISPDLQDQHHLNTPKRDSKKRSRQGKARYGMGDGRWYCRYITQVKLTRGQPGSDWEVDFDRYGNRIASTICFCAETKREACRTIAQSVVVQCGSKLCRA